MLQSVNILGKYLDQPALVKGLSRKVPGVLAGGAAVYGIYDTAKVKTGEKKPTFIRNLCILSSTVGAALIGTRGLKIGNRRIIKGIIHQDHCLNPKTFSRVINRTAKKLGTDSPDFKQVENLVNRIKDGVYLKLSEIKTLSIKLKEIFPEEKLLDKLIPLPHKHGVREMLGEMATLSYTGLIPVAGGIAGGILGDRLTRKDWKGRIPDKVKEGSYQYLANIFLCNVGAGAAMIGLNRLGVKSRAKQAVGAIAGVLLVGVLMGSQIANLFGKKVINPVFDRHKRPGHHGIHHGNHNHKGIIHGLKQLNNERHPELIDVSLHIDDVAAVGFLSGLKWIGPVLPILYSVSAYRAGIGYRNGDGDLHGHRHNHKFIKYSSQVFKVFE